MTHPLQSVTDELNAMLAEAGAVDAAGDPMRWTLDTDGESNSAGTWFCGTLGGVTDEASMREHTARIIERRQAAQARWVEQASARFAVVEKDIAARFDLDAPLYDIPDHEFDAVFNRLRRAAGIDSPDARALVDGWNCWGSTVRDVVDLFRATLSPAS